MKLKTADEVIRATSPRQLFELNLDTLEMQRDEYLELFKPAPYNTVKHFMASQKVIQLYRKALELLEAPDHESTLQLVSKDGQSDCSYNIYNFYDSKLGTMYVSDANIIFVVHSEYKEYYENYIQKASSFTKISKEIWDKVKYSLPKLASHFECEDGDFAIILKKPKNKIYPLREILEYCGGSLSAEVVTSILTRLHYFACYLDLIGITHNAITIDNLFFAPGNFVENGQKVTLDDIRIVGVYGGWFFSTWTDEQIKGMPKEILDIAPASVKEHGFSNFAVDSLAIKRIARELLGDPNGAHFRTDVPEPLATWLNSSSVEKNAYEQFGIYDEVLSQSFPSRRFVPLDISIK
ncbi:MAG: hypothetical protein IJX99_02335 [Clostridia bacterium]|nr:hypothetical protein [Clostridia bacterium]